MPDNQYPSNEDLRTQDSQNTAVTNNTANGNTSMTNGKIAVTSGNKTSNGNTYLTNDEGEAPALPEEQEPRAGSIARNIEALGTPNPPSEVDSRIHCMTIIGQVEGHVVLPPQNKTTKYEHVIPQLVAIEQNDDIEGLLLVLNTVGGDVEAGLAIAEMVASLSKPTVSLVLGGGHSIGVPIAVSADYSYIAETASMTIHPIRLTGMVIGVPQSFEYMERMQERVTRFVVQHSNIKESMFRDLMLNTGELARDIGTTVVGKDAVNYGLVDSVGGLGDAIRKLNGLMAAKAATGQQKGLVQ